MKRTLLFLIAFYQFWISFAQSPNLLFDQITDKSGRSLGFITGIVQDTTGFMWFSTRNGLVRYDGYDYKLFKTKPNDSLSLPFNDITNLYYDRDGLLWMRHYDQYFAFKNEKLCYKFDSITSKHYDTEAKITEDKHGYLWIGPSKNGLMRYDKKNKKVDWFKNLPKSYKPELANWLEINKKTKTLVSLGEIQNEKDTSLDFTIKNTGWYLIVSLGEGYRDQFYDFGSIKNANNKIIWEMQENNCRFPGGNDKNKIQIELIELKSGKYKVCYQSDNSNSWNNWTDLPPSFCQFYGICILELNNIDKKELETNLLKEYRAENSLSSNQIGDMIIDNHGNLVCINEKGLDIYNPKTGQFIFSPIDYSKLLNTDQTSEHYMLYQDSRSAFWIATSLGLIQYDKPHNCFITYSNQKNNDTLLTSNTIYTVYEDQNGIIWVGTDNGLNLLDRKTNKVYKYSMNNINRLYDNRILKFYEDRSGNLWVASFQGLNRLKKSLFKYTPLETEKYDRFPVVFDGDSKIWYHGNKNNLNCYLRSTKTIKQFPIDKKIFAFDNELEDFDFQIKDIVQGDNNKLWLAINNGIFCYDENKGKILKGAFVNAVIVENDSAKNQVLKILKYNSQTFVVFSVSGLHVFRTEQNKFIHFQPYTIQYESITDVDFKHFKSADKDKNGLIWVRTNVGVYTFNPANLKWSQIYNFKNEIMPGLISDGNIYQDKQGNIWFSALPDLIKVDIQNLKARKYHIENATDVGLCNVTSDEDGKFWIYTNNGLYCFDTTNQKSVKYTNDDGLADNSLNGLIDDMHGHLWITSFKGLSRFDKNDGSFISFFRSGDFETYTFLGANNQWLHKNKELLFFTTHGYVSFWPDSINKNIPSIAITRFTIFGREYELDSLIYQKRRITLKYNQNFLSFEFSALDFTDPSKNKYSFFLENLDKEWAERDADDRRATYTGLQPGDYVLHIKACNNDKIWNDTGVKLYLTVTPPWYRTIVAYIAYIVLTALAFISFIRYREQKLKQEKAILEQKVIERTAEIEKQKKEIEHQRDEIIEQKKNITDSIHYASRIQTALLPSQDMAHQMLPEHFILWRPRDIVSGDFYWMTQRGDETVVVAADSTGHGVPGAFMSMLGVAFLNEIVNRNNVLHADEILNQMREHVMKSLHQTGKEGETKDGMDMALVIINMQTMKMQYAGAYNSAYMIRNKELIEIKADRMPIGYSLKLDHKFTNNDIDIQEGDQFYLYSDGYSDQFGGNDARKFMSKKFKELLLSISDQPMSQQKETLLKAHLDWRGSKYEQIDDVLIVGVKISATTNKN